MSGGGGGGGRGENVIGYRLGISCTCTGLRYKPPFIATW